jgi:hypothetical protein
MKLLYACDACGKMVVMHSGDMSRIDFARLPTVVLQASNHKCSKKEAA